MADNQLPSIPASMPSQGNAFTRWLGRTILRLLGWTMSGNLPDQKKLMVAAAPHTSNWDFILGSCVMLALGVRVTFMMKQEAFKGPVGYLARKIGFIAIDRSRPGGVVPQMVQWFHEHDKVWIGVTPEGTRSKVKQWKTGFLRIAYEAKVPIFLVGINAPKKQICFDQVIETSGDHDQQIEEIRSYMMEHFRGIVPSNQ